MFAVAAPGGGKCWKHFFTVGVDGTKRVADEEGVFVAFWKVLISIFCDAYAHILYKDVFRSGMFQTTLHRSITKDENEKEYHER